MFNRWRKGHSERILDELCKITKNKFERSDKQAKLVTEWEKARGDRRKELDNELMELFDESEKSWDKENKLLKRVLKEKWAKEQIERQLDKVSKAELERLLRDGVRLKIFNLEKPELRITVMKLGKLPKKEIELMESGRLYLCNHVGISKFGADCALVSVYQRLLEKTGGDATLWGAAAKLEGSYLPERKSLEKVFEKLFEEERESEMLALRGIRFYYLVKILDSKLADLWKNDRGTAMGSLRGVFNKTFLSEYFNEIYVSDVDLNAPQGWVGVKVSCTIPKVAIARSDAIDFYETLLVEFDKYIKSTPKAEFKLYFFEPLERHWPPKSEEENIVPVSMFEPVTKKAIEIIKKDLKSVPKFKKSGKNKL